MKDAIPADRLLFEIGPKAYLYGAGVVVLVRAADRASEGRDATVVFTSSILEACAVVDNVEHTLVYVLHPDPIRPGREITDILPEVLVEAGMCMVMLNHAEHPITSTVLEKTMQRAVEVGLAAAMCASSLVEARAMASPDSDLLIAEPTEPIGTGKPSEFDYVEASNCAAREINSGVRVFQRAGILTPTDVEAVIRNGADATGLPNAIATTSGPSAMTEAMIRAARRGRDARPRS